MENNKVIISWFDGSWVAVEVPDLAELPVQEKIATIKIVRNGISRELVCFRGDWKNYGEEKI